MDTGNLCNSLEEKGCWLRPEDYSKDSQKQSDYGYTLKIDSTRFSDDLHVRCESKMEPKVAKGFWIE